MFLEHQATFRRWNMRRILNESAKEQVITIMAFGGTRESAAAHLNCHPRTIYNATKRDPEFAARLIRAYPDVELTLVNTLVKSSASGTANSAKWLLERLNPDKFGKRKPGVYTLAMIQSMFGKLAEQVIEHAPSDSHRDFALRMLTHFGREQMAMNQPFLEDCLPLNKQAPDYVEEARKRREEYEKFDAEEELAYREYEAEQAAKKKEYAEEKAAREREAQEQAAKEQAAAASAKSEAQPQVAPVAKTPKLSKSAKRKQYEAARAAAAAAAAQPAQASEIAKATEPNPREANRSQPTPDQSPPHSGAA